MSTPPPPSSSVAENAGVMVDPLAVGTRFVKTYYSSLVEFGDSSLSKFYQKSSQLSYGIADDFAETQLQSRTFPEKVSSVDISAIDSQRMTGGNSILVVITGKLVLASPLSNNATTQQGFVQTFVLSPQGPRSKAFSVSNDILRLLKRDDPVPMVSQGGVVVAPPPVEPPKPLDDEPLTQSLMTAMTVDQPEVVSPQVPVPKSSHKHGSTQPNGGKPKPQKHKPLRQSSLSSPGNGAEESKEPVLLDDDAPPTNMANGEIPETNIVSSSTTTPKQPWGGARNANHHPTTKQAGPSNPKQPHRDPDCTIVVKQLDETITSDEIRNVFSEYGEIQGISVLANRGFAYVDFKTNEPVQKILAKDDFRIKERNVSVSAKLAKPMAGRGGRYRSGGGRFARGGQRFAGGRV